MQLLKTFREEFPHLLKLAVPVIISQVGSMTMGLVDTVMVGHYSSLHLAGVAAGNSVFWTIVMVGFGLLHGMDPIVSQAHGSGNIEEADRCLGVALQVGAYFSLLITPLIFLVSDRLTLFGVPADVAGVAAPFLRTLSLSLWPLMFYGAISRYWQGFEIVMPFTITTFFTNFVNWAGNYFFVAGHGGAPALGATGSAISTLVCRIFTLIAALAITLHFFGRQHGYTWSRLRAVAFRSDPEMMRRFFRIGLPAGLQILAEVFAFALATLVVSRLGAEVLATHHIVLNIASFAFMFPVGVSSAIAVRVGFHQGRREPRLAFITGWLGIGLAFLIMTISALAFLFFPHFLIGLYTSDASIVRLGGSVLFLCALFQVFDGVQVASAGALRGLGDTKTALYSNLAAHYGIGIPIGLTLCFHFGKGLTGIWIGLALGLCFTAIFNTMKWQDKRASLKEIADAEGPSPLA